MLSSSAKTKQRFGDLEAQSSSMREVFLVLERLAPTGITLLLSGEPGTGKGKLARAIHASSDRADGPFVSFDCQSVAPEAMEVEFFGCEANAALGTPARAGLFERARAGTLFLEEVSGIPLELQPRLLRVFEDQVVRRVGAESQRVSDVRLVAATSRDLRALIEKGSFQEDLYFCLAAAVVPVPPLRTRIEDLPLLVSELTSELGQPALTIEDEALEALRRQSWPGNLRQLKNTLACAVTFVEGGMLRTRDLRLSVPALDESDLDRLPLGGRPLADIERAAIKQTLQLNGGMKGHTARALGIAVSTLYDKLKRYGL